MFSIVAALIYIPTNNILGFSFSRILATLIIFCLFDDILTGMRQELVVLMCISLMIRDVDHLFMCLLAMCMPLKRSLFRSCVYFLIVVCF